MYFTLLRITQHMTEKRVRPELERIVKYHWYIPITCTRNPIRQLPPPPHKYVLLVAIASYHVIVSLVKNILNTRGHRLISVLGISTFICRMHARGEEAVASYLAPPPGKKKNCSHHSRTVYSTIIVFAHRGRICGGVKQKSSSPFSYLNSTYAQACPWVKFQKEEAIREKN